MGGSLLAIALRNASDIISQAVSQSAAVCSEVSHDDPRSLKCETWKFGKSTLSYLLLFGLFLLSHLYSAAMSRLGPQIVVSKAGRSQKK